MLVAGGKARDAKEARQMLNTLLQNGKAIDKFREFIIRQGGDASFLDDHKLLPKATHIVEVRADKEGFVSRMDAEKLGRAAMKLGAGRESDQGFHHRSGCRYYASSEDGRSRQAGYCSCGITYESNAAGRTSSSPRSEGVHPNHGP